jgi:DHA2 family multidrug resistance protein-like MFS transporter
MSRWIAAAGVAVVSLDSMLNIALPAMAASFAVPPEQVRWAIVCYVFTYALTSFAGGTAGDRLGHDRVFRAGVLVSALGFALCGAAPAFGWLLLGRVVQGFAGGLVYGTAPALVTLGAGAGERGRRLGFLNAALGAAFALGPLVAGVIVDALGWRWVFHVRIPLALAAFAWTRLGLPATRVAARARAVALADLVRRPVLHACALAFLANAGIFAIWLLAPFYLVDRRGLDASTGGVLFMLTPLGTAAAAPLAGRLTDRVGPRAPITAGLALEALGLLALAGAGPDTSLALVAGALLAAGLGIGVFQVPFMALVMASFPPGQQGAAGGLTFMARTLGIVAGVLTLAQIFALRRAAAGVDVAFAQAFLAAAAGVALAAGLAIALRSRPGRD